MTGTIARQRQDQLARLRVAMEAPSGRVTIVRVPMGNFLMIDGRGDATSEPFGRAVRALTDLSAGLRLYLQDGRGTLLDPMPVEILWSSPQDEEWQQSAPDEWSWTAMVAQPAGVSPELVRALRDRFEPLHDRDLLCRMRLGSLREGLCAQTAHAGRATRSAELLDRLLDQVRALGYEPHGPHHEIYLADLRHREARPLRTIVRQPIHRVA